MFELATAERESQLLARGVSMRRQDEGERAQMGAVDLDRRRPVSLERTDGADVGLGLED